MLSKKCENVEKQKRPHLSAVISLEFELIEFADQANFSYHCQSHVLILFAFHILSSKIVTPYIFSG